MAAEVAGGGIRTRFDETTDRFVSEIMDSNHEVIRQVPPEEVLKVIANVRRVQGLLFDEEA